MRKKYTKFIALISIILCSNVHAYPPEEVPLEDQETQSKLVAFTTAQLEAVEMPDDVRDFLSNLGIDYNKTITFRNKKNENEIHAFIPSSDGGAVYIFTNGSMLHRSLNAESSKPYRQLNDMAKLLAQHLPLSHQSQVLNPPPETKNYDTLAAFYTSGNVGRQVLIGFNKVDEHATVYTRNPDGGWVTSSLKISEADKKYLAQNANHNLLNSFIHNGVLVINSSSAIKSSKVFPTEASVMPTSPLAASVSPGGPANSRALIVVPDTQESNSLGSLKQTLGSLLSSIQTVPRVPDKESDGPNKEYGKQKLHQNEKHGSKHSGNGRRGLWSNLYDRWFNKRFDNKEDLLRAKTEIDEEEVNSLRLH